MGLDRLTRRPKPLAPEELRKVKPERNPVVEVHTNDDGGILLVAPLEQQGRGFAAVLAKWMKVPATKKFELEPVGAFVWSLCDGGHTFDAISRKLRDRYKMNRLESDAALSEFLRTLGQRRLITLSNGRKK